MSENKTTVRVRSHIGSLDAMMSLGEKYLSKEDYQDMCDTCGSLATYLRLIKRESEKQEHELDRVSKTIN